VASEEVVAPQTADAPQELSVAGGVNPKNNQPVLEAKTPEIPRMPPEDLVFDTPDARFTFNQDTASLVSVLLKQYRETNSPDSAFVELLHRPLVIQPTQGGVSAKPVPVAYSGKRTEDGISFSRTEGPWTITQEWIVPKSGYVGKLTTSWTNIAGESKNLAPVVLMEMGAKAPKTSSSMFIPGAPNEAPRILTQFDGTDDFYNMDGFCKDQAKFVSIENKKLDFFGFDHHYFAAAFVPASSATYKFMYSSQVNDVCSVIGTISSDFGAIAPNQSASMSWDFWTGPKEVELLTAFNPHLRTTLGLGWLDMIAHPLLLAIKGFYKFTGNHGIAIILLTLVLKILFYPLARQAAISAARMKKLNPEMTKLREKYKADPQKMQMELMKFMSQNKINPMKGCLPMLPTIPVFFALFRVLSASIDLRHAPFYFWIHDLSAMDPYYVSPIILTGLMFLQQKLTPMTGMDPTQEKVMMMMPLIFGVMMISLPSGLVLYMLTNTIVTIAQQHYLNQKLAETI
jgi:YidC/Oxa1 family membrane protein insertase